MKKFIFFLLFIILSINLVYADLVPSTSPCWVKGTVTSTDFSVVDGLIVQAYKGSTLLMSSTVASGVYNLNSLGANSGDTIILKVYGAPFSTFTFEAFCKTGTDPWIVQNLVVNKQANGVTCSSATICTNGYCTGGLCASAPPASGGGGGGGGSAPVSTTITPLSSIEGASQTTQETESGVIINTRLISSNGESATVSVSQIPAGDSVIVPVPSGVEDLPVVSLTITAEEKMIQPVFSMQSLPADTKVLPESASLLSIQAAPQGSGGLASDEAVGVYAYLTFNLGGGMDNSVTDIKENKVSFKVEKSWLDKQSASEKDIVLKRFNNGKWSNLPTAVTKSDDKYYYFTATSPGFSVYAIALIDAVLVNPDEKEVVVTPEVTDTEEKPVVTETNVSTTEVKEEVVKTSSENKTLGWMVLLIILIASVIGYYFYAKRE